MSNVPNQNGSGLEQQFAGLDLQSGRQQSGGRYVPPHLRNKLSNYSQGGDQPSYDSRDCQYRSSQGRGNYSRGSEQSHGGDYGGNSGGRGSSSGNYPNRRNEGGYGSSQPYANGGDCWGGDSGSGSGGSNYRSGGNRENDWGNRGNSLWQERGNEPPPTRNDWWQDPQNRSYGSGSGSSGSRWKDGGHNQDVDCTIPTARDEHLEYELFGLGNTGINFNKYEDIPVEATGDNVPEHIISDRDFMYIYTHLQMEEHIRRQESFRS